MLAFLQTLLLGPQQHWGCCKYVFLYALVLLLLAGMLQLQEQMNQRNIKHFLHCKTLMLGDEHVLDFKQVEQVDWLWMFSIFWLAVASDNF